MTKEYYLAHQERCKARSAEQRVRLGKEKIREQNVKYRALFSEQNGLCAIGRFSDNPELICKAVKYLSQNRELSHAKETV